MRVAVVLLMLAGCAVEPVVVAPDEQSAAAPHPRDETAGGVFHAHEPGMSPASPGAGACPPLEPRDVDEPDEPDVAAPLPDLGVAGPHLVGVKTVELTDASRDRTFKVDIWYPATAGGEDNVYEIEMPIVGGVGEIESPARRDAPLVEGEQFPAVIFSHGYGGLRFQSIFITEHLASHGFIVASPDHPGNTLVEPLALGSDEARTQSAVDRPLDLIVVLEWLIANEPVDASKIGVTGHSFGGWAALEVMRRDPRFVAAFPMAPGFKNGSTPDFVATIARPLMFIGGSVDDTCEFDEDQLRPYEIAQRPKHLLKVIGAGHLDFSDLCGIALARAFIDDGCDPEQIDPALVHARVRSVATAFAVRFVACDVRADALLDVDAVEALGNVEAWRE